ncbi:MAG: glutamate--tRNA ligase family protein, partial [Alphaproteobacteria bacterium]
MSPGHRGRFAPSPTGDLHMGSAATALVAWLAARSAGASFVLRVEDIDAPRVVPGCEAEQLDELRWLGLDWDEGPDAGGCSGPYRQSERIALYEAALDRLRAHGLTYLCDCSRAEIARVASAPHAGDEGPRYPGTCRPHAHADGTVHRVEHCRGVAHTSRDTQFDAEVRLQAGGTNGDASLR